MDQCRQAVIARGVVLPHQLRDDVAKAGHRLGVEILTDEELAALLRETSRHDPSTGHYVDGDGALAIREELYARQIFRAS
jgi:hypothetical protein